MMEITVQDKHTNTKFCFSWLLQHLGSRWSDTTLRTLEPAAIIFAKILSYNRNHQFTQTHATSTAIMLSCTHIAHTCYTQIFATILLEQKVVIIDSEKIKTVSTASNTR